MRRQAESTSSSSALRESSNLRLAKGVFYLPLFVLPLVQGGLQPWFVAWFLVWFGLTYGIFTWSAILRVAQTRWSPAVNRVGHGGAYAAWFGFWLVPLTLVCTVYYAGWAKSPVPGKSFWLNVPFMLTRELLGFTLLAVLSYLMVRRSLALDAKSARGEMITEKDHYRLTALSIALIITYVIVASMIAYDFVMAFSPEWVSTMFAPYFWITNLYAGMAALIILCGWFRKRLNVEQHLGPAQFQDMGNLMLAFGFFSMGLFFAQYLTIWYGNLHWETKFLIIRYYKGPWPPIAWTAFVLEFAIPFLLLQSRAIKRNPKFSMPIAGLALVGFALERYILVMPSFHPDKVVFGWLPALGVLFVIGGIVLFVTDFLSRYSPISAADAALPDPRTLEEAE